MSNNSLDLALRIKADLAEAKKQLEAFEQTIKRLDTSSKNSSKSAATMGVAVDKVGNASAKSRSNVGNLTGSLVNSQKISRATARATQSLNKELLRNAPAVMASGLNNAAGAANKADAEFKKADRTLSKTSKSARSASGGLGKASENAGKLRTEASALSPALTRLAGLLITAFSAREIAAASNEMTTIRNRLALVTDSTEELAAAQDDVFRVAQTSRQPLSDTAELYQRIATNAEALELSGAGVADVVQTINKTLAISNTSGPAASAALTQLSQAFASGVLRGEELNSVLEQAPALAQAIAEGMGKTTGELRALGEEGKLTAQNVVQALLSQADAVDEQFGKIEVSGAQALTQLGNSLTKIVGDLDSATGAGSSFASTVVELSNYLDSGVLTDGAIESLSIWSSVFEQLSDSINNSIVDLDALQLAGGDVGQFLARAFIELPANIKAGIEIYVVETLENIDRVIAYANYASDAIAAIFSDDTQDDALNRLEQKLAQIESVRADSIALILEENEAIKAGAKAETERREQERKARGEARQLRQKEIAELRENARKNPINLAGGNGNTIDEKTKYVEKLEEEARALTLTTGALNDYKNAQQELNGTLLERAIAAQQAIQLAEDEKVLAKARIQSLRDQGREFEASSLEFEAEYGELIERLKARGDTEGLSLVDQILDLDKLKTRLDETEKIIAKTLSDQQQQEQSIANQREAGLITEAEARRRIVELHQETYALLEKQRPVLEELAKQPGVVGEEAAKALAGMDAQAEKLLSTVSLFEATLRGSVEAGLTEAITGLADGTLSFRDAIKSLASTVADAIIQMQAQQIAESITGSLFGGGNAPSTGNNGATTAQSDLAVATEAAAASQRALASASSKSSTGLDSVASGSNTAASAFQNISGPIGAFIGALQAAAAAAAANSTADTVGAAAGAASKLASGGYVSGPGTSTSDSIPAMLSDGEFVTRAAVVAQTNALDFLHDFNRRGMDAVKDWAPSYHNTGGLAGVPAPAMRTPLPPTISDSANRGATLENKQNFYLIDDPSRISEVIASPSSQKSLLIQISRDPAKFRNVLGLNN